MDSSRNEIVFICTANTCRSPMAAGLFRHALNACEEPLKSLVVSSAGVSASQGQPVHPNSVAALKKVGIDIAGNTSKALSQDLVDRTLAFICMTESHLALLNYHIDPPPANAFLMRQFMGGTADPEIPDPFGMDYVHYEASRDSMVEAIPSLVEAVRKLKQEADNDRPA